MVRRPHSGFTLVTVLIVSGIIAILIALVTTAVHRGRDPQGRSSPTQTDVAMGACSGCPDSTPQAFVLEMEGITTANCIDESGCEVANGTWTLEKWSDCSWGIADAAFSACFTPPMDIQLVRNGTGWTLWVFDMRWTGSSTNCNQETVLTYVDGGTPSCTGIPSTVTICPGPCAR